MVENGSTLHRVGSDCAHYDGLLRSSSYLNIFLDSAEAHYALLNMTLSVVQSIKVSHNIGRLFTVDQLLVFMIRYVGRRQESTLSCVN